MLLVFNKNVEPLNQFTQKNKKKQQQQQQQQTNKQTKSLCLWGYCWRFCHHF